MLVGVVVVANATMRVGAASLSPLVGSSGSDTAGCESRECPIMAISDVHGTESPPRRGLSSSIVYSLSLKERGGTRMQAGDEISEGDLSDRVPTSGAGRTQSDYTYFS